VRKLAAVDLETACTVQACQDVGKSMCRNGHSLSPWHSRITTIAVATATKTWVFSENGPAALEKLLSRELSDYEITGQNFKFDWLHLAVHGFKLPLERWTSDSQVAAFVLTEKIPDAWLAAYEIKRAHRGSHHRKAGKHSLKTLAPFFLKVEPFWEVEDHADATYALKDAVYTLDLTMELERRLEAKGEIDFYRNRLLPWTKMLAEAELRGIQLDTSELEKVETEMREKSESARLKLEELWADGHMAYAAALATATLTKYQKMSEKAGKPFNEGSRYWKLYTAALAKLPTRIEYDSPKQMTWLLRDFLGYDIQGYTGEETTGREVLERLSNEGHEDVKTYLEWRQANKILTAFLPTYRELSDLSPSGPLLHPIYNTTSTRTGRTSSERPNCQQVPKGLKRVFKPREGYSIIGYDQSAIEARLISLYTADPALHEIVSSGASIHDYNVRVFFDFDTPLSDVKTKHAAERVAAKNVGFALFYNAGANRIRIAFAQRGYHLNNSQCKQLLHRFRESYETAFEYSREIVNHMEDGNVLPNILGRPVYIENPEDCYMKAFNMLVQSSASDLLLEGSLRALTEMRVKGLDAHPLLFVHDYVGFEVSDADVEVANEIIKSCLTSFHLENSLGITPLEVEGGVSKVWE